MAADRAALYLRLSKEDKDKMDESASIRNQRLLLTEYAKRAGYRTAGIYVDDDESGLYWERPGFTRLMEDARGGKFDVVIAKSQSRFSRNMEHVERVLHRDFPLMGIRFIGVCDHADTEDAGNKKSRQINGLVNEWYCEDLSRNIKSVFRAKMAAGEFLGASCPYGYRKEPGNHNHLIVDKYAASIVKRIFALYLDGHGKAGIGRILSEEGVLIPTLYKQQILGVSYHNAKLLDTTKAWSYQTIHSILNNQVYTGNLVQNKCGRISYKDKRVRTLPKEKWIVAEHTHEPIIDLNTWQMVQERQKARTRETDIRKGNRLFTGKVFCADCKKAMAGNYTGGKFSGYICKTYKRQGKQFCESHRIGEDELESLVSSIVGKEMQSYLTKEDIKKLHHMRIDTKKEAEQEAEAMKNRTERQIQTLMRYKQKCLERFLDGMITEADFCMYQSDYDERLQALKRQEKAERRMQEEPEWDAEMEAERLLDEIKAGKLSRELVDALIERIEVKKDGGVTVYFRFKAPMQGELFPKTKRSVCGDGGTHCGERDGIRKQDE